MTVAHRTQDNRWTSRWARACVASGVLGLLAGVLTLVAPKAVDDGVWSYPFSFEAGLALGGALALIHLMTLLGFLALHRVAAGRAGRSGGIAIGLAVAGLALLAGCELVGGLIGRASVNSTAAGVVGAAFAVASLPTAVGSVWAGALHARRRAGPPLAAWAALASGVVLLVLVTPANAVGDPVLRTGALMLWSLCFVPMGVALGRPGRASVHVPAAGPAMDGAIRRPEGSAGPVITG